MARTTKREPADELQRFTEYELTAAERDLLDVLLNPDFRKFSITDVCKEAKISRPTYYAAMNRPEFVEALKAESLKLVSHSVPSTIKALQQAAQRGNLQAIRMVLEMAGMYSEHHTIDGPEGGAIPVKLAGRISEMSDADLMRLADMDAEE